MADVFLSDGRFLIRHEGGVRQQLVTCNVRGRDVESFVAEASRRVQQLAFPLDVTYSFTGAHELNRPRNENCCCWARPLVHVSCSSCGWHSARAKDAPRPC